MSTKELSSLADVELRVEPHEEEDVFHNTELQHIYFILHMFLLPSLFFLSFVLIYVQLVLSLQNGRKSRHGYTQEDYSICPGGVWVQGCVFRGGFHIGKNRRSRR